MTKREYPSGKLWAKCMQHRTLLFPFKCREAGMCTTVAKDLCNCVMPSKLRAGRANLLCSPRCHGANSLQGLRGSWGHTELSRWIFSGKM